MTHESANMFYTTAVPKGLYRTCKIFEHSKYNTHGALRSIDEEKKKTKNLLYGFSSCTQYVFEILKK